MSPLSTTLKLFLFSLSFRQMCLDAIRPQLLYLNYESASKPVYMYINTPGTSTPDGRAIGFETEAFAISDCMNYIKPPVYTIGVGQVGTPTPRCSIGVALSKCPLAFVGYIILSGLHMSVYRQEGRVCKTCFRAELQ